MEHWFYHKADGNMVETQLAGYLDFEPATARIRALQAHHRRRDLPAPAVRRGPAVG